MEKITYGEYVEKVNDFNLTRTNELDKRQKLLKEMFLSVGENCYIEPPLHANWAGAHVHFGNNVYANFGTLQRNTQIFYEHNVKGIYQQGVFYIAESDGEFGEMKAYLLAKLMSDPYMTEEQYYAHMDDFLEGYYGENWREVRKVIEVCQKHKIPYQKGGSIFRKTAEEIERIVVICKEYGVDYKESNSVFQNKPEVTEEIIKICIANGVDYSGLVDIVFLGSRYTSLSKVESNSNMFNSSKNLNLWR